MPAAIVPVSSTSIAKSGEMGLADTFICAGGAIVINQESDLVTMYARKKKWGQIARVEIGRLGDEKVKLRWDIGDEFTTGDCAMEKTARLHFGHILFVMTLCSRKGLRFVVKTGKWGWATLTPKQLKDFTGVWRRWNGGYRGGDDRQSKGKQFDKKSVEIDKGDTQSSSTTLNADDIEDEKSIWWWDDKEEVQTDGETIAGDGEDKCVLWNGKPMLGENKAPLRSGSLKKSSVHIDKSSISAHSYS